VARRFPLSGYQRSRLGDALIADQPKIVVVVDKDTLGCFRLVAENALPWRTMKGQPTLQMNAT
jgi:hypothetical protein